jgi:hypothetical protein
MSTLVGPWPPTQLPIDRAKHGEPMLSDVVRVPGANVSAYHAHTMGLDTVGTSAAQTPINGFGSRGHDHSGGDFGRPLFRSIYAATLDPGGQVSANIVATNRVGRVVLNGDPGTTPKEQITHPLFVWVPPCPAGGAYDNCGVHIVAEVVSTTLTASDEMTVRLRNLFPGYQRAVSFSVSSPNSTGEKLFESRSNSERLELIPGALQAIRLEAEVALDGGGSNRGVTIDFYEIEIGVYES